MAVGQAPVEVGLPRIFGFFGFFRFSRWFWPLLSWALWFFLVFLVFSMVLLLIVPLGLVGELSPFYVDCLMCMCSHMLRDWVHSYSYASVVATVSLFLRNRTKQWSAKPVCTHIYILDVSAALRAA